MRRISMGLNAVLMVTFLTLTGCEDGNLFGRLSRSGDSGNATTLIADAQVAYRDKDYSRALSLYQEVLAKDPNNASALYGAAQAGIALSGINIGALVANISKQSNSGGSSSFSGFGDAVRSAREVIHATSTDPDSILAGITIDETILDLAICRLDRIIVGSTNGAIKSDDVDVIVNSAFLHVLRAVIKPYNAGYLDIVNNNGDYQVVKRAGFDTSCDTDTALVQNAAKDVANAYYLFNRAAVIRGIASGKIITDIRDDVKTIGDKFLNPSDPDHIPTACLNALDAVGINLNTYLTLAPVPGNC